jgi:hypothetical protein
MTALFDHHDQVDSGDRAMARAGREAGWEHSFDENEPRIRTHGRAAIAQDYNGTIVVPVMKYVLKQIEIAVSRYLLKEIPTSECGA